MRRRLQEEEPENVRQREIEKMYRASKILERMVNQNNFNDISVGENKKHPQLLSRIFVFCDRFSIL